MKRNKEDILKIIGDSLIINEKLNESHEISEVFGETLMFNPFTYEPCLAIMRKIPEGDRKEFTIMIRDDSDFDAKKKIKVIYRKNLKMPEGKVASQVAHAVKNLSPTPSDCDIIVLRVSDKKFNELVIENPECYIQVDKGLTVVEKGTQTAAAWIVKE